MYAHIDGNTDLLAASDSYDITVHGSLSSDNLSELNTNIIKSYLLGERYGDVTQTGYLAGEFLYPQSDTRTLSVTSLLDTPYETRPWFHIRPTGEIVGLYSMDGVVPPTVQTEIIDHEIEMTIRSGRDDHHIASIIPRFNSDTFLYQGCSASSIVQGVCDELPAGKYVFVASAENTDLE